MNLAYVKEYLQARKDNITSEDVEELINQINSFTGTSDNLKDISRVMRVINDYNITFLDKVQEYEVMPKDNIKYLPKRMEKVRDILCNLSLLHTYLVLSYSTIKDSTYNVKNIRTYMADLNEKKEHFKSEKMTWGVVLKSLIQETSFATDMRRMDIEDQVGYIKYKDTK